MQPAGGHDRLSYTPKHSIDASRLRFEILQTLRQPDSMPMISLVQSRANTQADLSIQDNSKPDKYTKSSGYRQKIKGSQVNQFQKTLRGNGLDISTISASTLVLGRKRAFLLFGSVGSLSFTATLDQNMSLKVLSAIVSNIREMKKKLTFSASFLEKLFSQCPQGKGFTAR